MEDLQKEKKKPQKLTSNSQNQIFLGLDCSFQGIKHLSASLFSLTFIKELNLKGNELEYIPENICTLQNLEVLELSKNKIKFLPSKLGKMVSLKELYLSDNLISNIPMDLGSLYNMTTFVINNNPLISPFNLLYKDEQLLQYCREHNTNYAPPTDRIWMDVIVKKSNEDLVFSCGTYNILVNCYATKLRYPPSWILNPEYRKENILQSICSFNVDILCLQEIEKYNFEDFYREQLELRCEYDSIFSAKGRSKNGVDSKTIDGCATFWKKSKFTYLESLCINFYELVIKDKRFSDNFNITKRFENKNNIALVTVLRCNNTNKKVIVANVHLYWDPDFEDVKFIQALVLLENLQKIQMMNNDCAIILLGDFNSLPNSDVYKLIKNDTKSIKENNDKIFDVKVEDKDLIDFLDAYACEDTDFTNFTPTFKGVIDYIFHTKKIELQSILSTIEQDYCDRVVGLPNIHFPSDHIFIASKFTLQ